MKKLGMLFVLFGLAGIFGCIRIRHLQSQRPRQPPPRRQATLRSPLTRVRSPPTLQSLRLRRRSKYCATGPVGLNFCKLRPGGPGGGGSPEDSASGRNRPIA